MTPDRIVSGARAQRQLRAGIDALADVLAVTLGPVGRNVVVENELTHKPEILESAAEIARRMTSLSAAHQNTGAMLLRHLVWRVVRHAGDGGATAAVFARALYRDALRLVAAGMDPLKLCAGIEAASAVVLSALQAQARPVETEDDLAWLALSLTDDPPLARILGEMSYLLGANAVIAVEKVVVPTVDRVYVSGSAYPAQIASAQFYTQTAPKRAAATRSLIALVDDALQTSEEAATLLQAALATGTKHLTIVTSQPIAEKALSLLIANHRSDQVPLAILAVRLLEVDADRGYPLNDLALLTGATVLSTATGQSIAHLRADPFGSAQRVALADGKLILEMPPSAAVQATVEVLRDQLDEIEDAAERTQLQARLSALTGGIGYLRIGAYGDQERALRAKHAERALTVLAMAQRSGVVAGGGAALVHAAAALRDCAPADEVERHGVKLFARALSAPLLQILHNSGVDAPGAVVEQISNCGAPTTYDAIAGEFVNAHERGILTPVPVLATVVRMATSSVVMALTTGTILTQRAGDQIESLEP